MATNRSLQYNTDATLQIINLPFDYQQYGFLVVPQADRKQVIPMKDIAYVKSDNNYAVLVLQDKKILLSKTLKWVAEKLDKHFLRVHNSYVVNLLEVKEYIFPESKIILSNGVSIPVARSKKKEVDQIFK